MSMSLRQLVLLIASAETLLWLFFLGNELFSGTNSDTYGMNRDIAIFATGVFAISGAPALGLALWGRWLRIAVALAVFPVAAITGAVLWGP
jgi:hypothetical protein